MQTVFTWEGNTALSQDGTTFCGLNKNGKLDPYEDLCRSIEERLSYPYYLKSYNQRVPEFEQTLFPNTSHE